MKRELYVITYDNAHYCGGELNCLVWGLSENDAVNEASDFMHDSQLELFEGHYEEDGVDTNEGLIGMYRAELVTGSEYEEFINMPDQASFYPIVNQEKANE